MNEKDIQRLIRIESKVSALLDHMGLDMNGEPVDEQFVVLIPTPQNTFEAVGPYTYKQAIETCRATEGAMLAPFTRRE